MRELYKRLLRPVTQLEHLRIIWFRFGTVALVLTMRRAESADRQPQYPARLNATCEGLLLVVGGGGGGAGFGHGARHRAMQSRWLCAPSLAGG